MSSGTLGRPLISAEARHEAAVWIARLHAPDRDTAVEAGLRCWLKESTEHQRAFEQANEIWATAARIPERALPRMRWKQILPAPRFSWLAIAASTCVAFALILVYLHRDAGLATGVGEQRIVTLDDGTRVSLNTATRIVVDYDARTRRVRLIAGEALFEVAKRPLWPFVVNVGNKAITALGTSFVVRCDERQTAVTLVDGKVTVAALASSPSKEDASAVETMSPGERLTFVGLQTGQVDRPKLDRLTAWQHGQVALDFTRLGDAAEEMSRYSRTKLVIEQPTAADVRISGVFRTGDLLAFAQAMAQTYQLAVSERPGEIILSGAPALQH